MRIRVEVLKLFWASDVEDDFHLANLIQTKAAFLYAAAVMDRIGGWEEGNEEDLVGA